MCCGIEKGYEYRVRCGNFGSVIIEELDEDGCLVRTNVVDKYMLEALLEFVDKNGRSCTEAYGER